MNAAPPAAPERLSSPRRAAVWTLGGYAANQVLRFGNNVILARFLTPDVFGLMALVYTFVTGLKLLSDLGLRSAIIQNERGMEPAFYNTAWTMQVLRGCMLAVIAAVLAWPIGYFYEEPRLAPVLAVLGSTLAIDGFASTSIATLGKKLKLGRTTALELGAQAATVVVMVIWAMVSPTVWALVSGVVGSRFIYLLFSHRLDRNIKNRFSWDPEARQALFAFGRWAFLSTAMTFLAGQSDRLILGKLLSLETLGIYSIALNLSQVPQLFGTLLSDRVLFPLLSSQKDLPREQLGAELRRRRWRLLALVGLIVMGLLGLGDVLIRILYPSDYHAAGWMLMVLAIGGWVVGITVTARPVLLAIGKPKYNAFAAGTRFVFLVAGLPLGHRLFGLAGAIAVMSLAELPAYVVNVIALRYEKLSCLRQDAVATLLLAVGVGLTYAVRMAFGLDLPQIS